MTKKVLLVHDNARSRSIFLTFKLLREFIGKFFSFILIARLIFSDFTFSYALKIVLLVKDLTTEANSKTKSTIATEGYAVVRTRPKKSPTLRLKMHR